MCWIGYKVLNYYNKEDTKQEESAEGGQEELTPEEVEGKDADDKSIEEDTSEEESVEEVEESDSEDISVDEKNNK